MAASAAIFALSSSTVGVTSTLSSRSSFASQPINAAAPTSRTAKRAVVAVRASAPKEARPARKELIAGLVAAGAALAVAGSSMQIDGSAFAVSGPGNDGAAITAKLADDLLKAGDDLVNNDSPPRYGGERVGAQAQKNADKIAQQGGSGAVEGLQNSVDAGNDAVSTAKTNVEKTGQKLGEFFNQDKSSGNISSTDPLEGVSNVKEGVKDLLGNGSEKVKSDIESASQKVGSDVATAANGRTAGDAVETGKGFFNDLKNKITDSISK
ncbi:hypothetical protein R1flu_016167 [Riccia fluitans]|uniref:Uncharacterized protein n=1 Tax=Riccia fluitans TaxID=41844 RepID=A0ABD1YL30_9MARC